MSHIPRYTLVIFLAILICACSSTPDETQIQSALDEIFDSVENRKARPILAHLAENFSGPNNMGKQQINPYVRGLFLRYKKLTIIRTTPLEMTFNDRDAIVNFSVSVSHGPGMIPDQIRLYSVRTGWRKTDNQWQVLQADWQPQ